MLLIRATCGGHKTDTSETTPRDVSRRIFVACRTQFAGEIVSPMIARVRA
jgi:hypothetical protein